MRTKKIVYLFSVLLLLSVFAHNVGAQPINSVSFYGVGVTIDLTFPEEAHPGDSMQHNLNVTASTALTLKKFNINITAQVNSSWQQIYTWEIQNFPMEKDQKLPLPIEDQLPQDANGRLQCFIYVRTQRLTTIDDASYTFYTTQVRNLTYSELLSEHNELKANYSALNSSFTELSNKYYALSIEHNETLRNYASLLADYNSTLFEYQNLNTTYNGLYSAYGTLNSTYNSLTSEYGTLNSTYNLLLANYNNLNSTFYSLLAANNALQSNYSSLNSTYNTLQTNYTSLDSNYNSLLSKNNGLQSNYDSLDSDYNSLDTLYKSLLSDKGALQLDYDSLNSTNNSVQASFGLLREAYGSLNGTYTALKAEVNGLAQRANSSENSLNVDRVVMFIFLMAVVGLIALIIYLKKKEPEPYVVIRKETVAVNPEENQQPEQQQ